jgi:hypothetical protein
MRATVGIMIITIMATGCAAAQTRSIEEMVATASFVPPPSALPSMPSSQWCKVVDAALLNPHISADRREDYISVGASKTHYGAKNFYTGGVVRSGFQIFR